MAMQENPAPGPVEGRRGTCRICFEDDGDLIQPCLCKGSSQWVHRGCLNHWRAMGLSKDSMTRCPSCKYNYRLKFQRVHAQDDDLSLRKRRFFQNLATQGCSAFIAVQIAIICLGMVIRAADPNEVLVQVFGFPQDPGQDQPGDFMNALHHHKLTYYTAGTIAFVACLGLGGVYYYLFECCCGRSGARHAGATLDCTCRDCGDCCLMCQFCDCGDVCPATCPQFGGPAAVPDHPAVMVILLGVLVALIVIGLVMILVAGVACVQRAVQQYARLQQMRVLTEEYIVEDLASPFDLGEGSADGAAKQMEAEITEVMTGEPAPQRATLETTIYGTERV